MCKDIRVLKGFCWCWSICSTPSWWGSVPGVRRLRVGLNSQSTREGVCCCSVAQLCPAFFILWTAARQCSLSFTISCSLLKLMAIESVMPSNHLIICRSLLLLPSIFPSIRFFSNKSALHIRWPKYWSVNFSINPPSEYSGLISFRIDWFERLAIQETVKSLL